MSNNQKVTVKQFSNYLGVHRNTARKYYKMYLDILGYRRVFLTVYDISKLDDLEPDIIKKMIC